MQVTSHQAQAVIEGAEGKARELGLPVIIAVLDAGAHLKAFSRMDGAVLGSIDIAIGKARTARVVPDHTAKPSGNTASPALRLPASNHQRRPGAVSPAASRSVPATAQSSAPSAFPAARFRRTRNRAGAARRLRGLLPTLTSTTPQSNRKE